jgi:hypothetical protein
MQVNSISVVSGFLHGSSNLVHEGFDFCSSLFASNLNEIKQQISEWKDRYRGALIAWGQGDETVEDEFRDLLLTLIDKKETVIWLDTVYQNSRKDLMKEIAEKRPRAKFYRCTCDDNLTDALALHMLAENGHQRIGCVYPAKTTAKWVAGRLARLKSLCREKKIELCMLDDEQIDVDFPLDRLDRIVMHLLPDPYKTSREGISQHLMVSDQTLRLVKRIREGRLTALLAVNRVTAVMTYLKLLSAGMRIPDDISLLTFDNLPHTAIYPISTIDQGFESLGYFAAHLLLEDITVRCDSLNTVRGQPRYIDKGSLIRCP